MPSLNVEFRGNATGLSATYTQVERMTSRLAGKIGESVGRAAVAAGDIYGVESAFSKTVATADELVTASKRLGIGIEQLQILREAAKSNNVEFERFQSILEKIDVARAKALGTYPGVKPAAQQQSLEAFAALGVNQTALQSQTAADLLMGAISEKIKTSNTERLEGDLSAIFGRGFGDVVPLLKTDFNEIGNQMREMGAIMETDVAIKMKVMGDEFSLISRILVAQLAPALLSFAQWAYKIILKGGGTIAGVSAYYGSLLSNKGLFDGAKLIASAAAQGLLSAITLGYFKPRPVGTTGEMSEAKTQFSNAKAPWQKALEDLAATIKAAQDQLKNPIPPPANFQTDRKMCQHQKKRNSVLVPI